MQEHERGLGGWQAQWHAVPALLLVTSGALAAIAELAQGLEIDAERMRDNLDIAQGLIMAEAVSMALGAKLGPHQAKLIVEEASKQAIVEQAPSQQHPGRRPARDRAHDARRARAAVRADGLPGRCANLYRPPHRLARIAHAEAPRLKQKQEETPCR